MTKMYKTQQDAKAPSIAPMFVIAHELYDALPIHQFKYKGLNQWCEKVIPLETTTNKDGTLDERI